MPKMGEIIKRLRLEHGMTQEELGKHIGVQKSAIRKYESGMVENIPRSSIEKMAELFGVRPSYLMGWESSQDMHINFDLQMFAENPVINNNKLDSNSSPQKETINTASPSLSKVLHSRLTLHDIDLLNAYHAQPELQPAVDKLLGIEREERFAVYTAAHSQDNQLDTVTLAEDKLLGKLRNTPVTDEDLI